MNGARGAAVELERTVARHYAKAGLERTILEALAASGKDVERLAPADLAPVDEFHLGGRQATVDLADQLPLKPGQRLLDIGSGIGGASRYFAGDRGAMVEGVDLTEDYVLAARALAVRVGLADRASYRQASALDLPFDGASFDGAYMLHVGMNIDDKPRLFAEARRVLKPGGFLAIYDVMGDSGGLAFPMPWASDVAASFVASAATYRELLGQAGFAVTAERDRRAFAVEFADAMRRRVAEQGPSPLGLQILMGASAPQKLGNLMAGLAQGLVSPREMIATAI